MHPSLGLSRRSRSSATHLSIILLLTIAAYLCYSWAPNAFSTAFSNPPIANANTSPYALRKNLRRTARSLQEAEVRDAEAHAFDKVDPVLASKADLELMVNHALPAASETTLEDLKYGIPEEISLDRRWDRVIYLITPTHRRETQMVDLMRMSHTLQVAAYTEMGIIHWVVVEDAEYPTRRIQTVLRRSGLSFSHLAHPSDKSASGRGMVQRNAGLAVVRRINVDGVIYFADDDNAYDTQLVTELTRTKSVAIFGTGLVGNGTYERCHVDNSTGTVDRLISGWDFEVKWRMDMSGFAFSTAWDAHRKFIAAFEAKAGEGSLEPALLEKLIPEGPIALQPLAANCTRLLAWHTHTSTRIDSKISMAQMFGDPDWHLVSALI